MFCIIKAFSEQFEKSVTISIVITVYLVKNTKDWAFKIFGFKSRLLQVWKIFLNIYHIFFCLLERHLCAVHVCIQP